MAVGKSRGSKRPSGGSCSSTATLLVFVFVCLFGVWMLTSTTFVSPRVKKATSLLDSVFDNNNLPKKITTHPSSTVFEDNQGDLPSDAIKTDEDLEKDHSSKQEDQNTIGASIETDEHEREIINENQDSLQEKVTSKKDQKHKTEETQVFERNTMPYKQHTEKLITDKINIQNEAYQQKSNRTKQKDRQNDSNEGNNKGNPVINHIIEEATYSETLNDSKSLWSTQTDQSRNQNEGNQANGNYNWELCNVTAGTDYIPCLDNEKAIEKLHGRHHFEHRERHCPEESPMCLVPLPEGYKTPIPWPESRNKIWFHNVPHKGLAKVKGHQNWVKTSGEFLTFPGGGTQFIHGAVHYIDFVQQMVPKIAWGKHTRVILDVGCGVASFGGYLFDKNVLTMSFAPKDEHEVQIQFALERGIPAMSAVMGTQRLPFPSNVFDLVHCARCRVPWHKEGGKLLLELNRVLRPGGYFVWSATPVYRKGKEDVQIWKEMSALTVAMCWELITIKKDRLNLIGVAVYQKPNSNECYNERKKQDPPMCKPDDDPNAAWYVPLQACMHKVPVKETERGSQWPEEWPARVQTPPYWLNKTPLGVYGKPTPKDFEADYVHWKRVVSKTYMSGLEINWSNVRNVIDMRAVYGGFAAALKDLKLWVLNVVNIDSPDTLPIIYERGLFGIYHDWCESFSTYPRTYDLVHADHLFSKLKKRCKITPVIIEVDRIVRPGGKLIIRDKSDMIEELMNLLKSLHWEVYLTSPKNIEQILSAQKSTWRPKTYANPF